MGIRDMLKGAADSEGALINKEINKSTKKERDEILSVQEEIITVNPTGNEDVVKSIPTINPVNDNENKEDTSKQKKSVSKKTFPTENKKVSSGGKPLGRKPNSTKNIENRKQYSITMRPSTYDEAVRRAIEEDVPFAKYVERAVLEYMKNHP